MSGWNIKQCVIWELKDAISQILKYPKEKLNIDEGLGDFGFDSISLAEFADVLSERYELEITPDIFFGYPTIERLSQYFLERYSDEMQAFYHESGKEVSLTTPPENRGQKIRKSRSEKLGTKQKQTGVEKEPIAIIGMSGRFPDARNVEELWFLLHEGREVISEAPYERVEWRESQNNTEDRKEVNKRFGVIPGISEFEPQFFEISPREAMNMDPRQRLLLQETWKALEDAGYGSKSFEDEKIGMFVGIEDGDYKLLVDEEAGITSNHNAILAARLSYFLNLDGPNMAINTACSSGLVAVHQACQSLRNGECDTAIVAGANLLITPDSYNAMNKAGMLSADGECYAFDKRANGMVPAEAVAVIVLKRLSKAESDGNPVYATIVGSGINYDGKTNGITAPSGRSQSQLIKEVYDRFHIKAEDMEYIVTHGTGTKLGDPIEINALAEAFKDYTEERSYCALTSTKPNIGHTLAASGIVSLISLVMSLKKETIPASINCEQVNDYIQWENSPFFINRENRKWTDKEGKNRLGAVSSFGMSGTNAHVVLQSYTPESTVREKENTQDDKPYYLLVLSAKTPEALQQRIFDLIEFFEENKSIEGELPEISYTLMEGRHHFDHRCAVVVKDREDAVRIFRQAEANEKLPDLFKGRVSRHFIAQTGLSKAVKDLIKQSHVDEENSNKYKESLCALAELYCLGYEVSCGKILNIEKINRVNLPTYPFGQKHYWVHKKVNRIDLNNEETAMPKDNIKAVDREQITMANMNQEEETSNRTGTLDKIKASKIILTEKLDVPVEIAATAETAYEKPKNIRLKPLMQLPSISEEEAIKTNTLQPLSDPDYGKSPGLSARGLLDELTESLAEELYTDVVDIEADRSFIELGLDSIIGIEWIHTINKKFKTSISTTKIYQYPTLMEFTKYFSDVLKEKTEAEEGPKNTSEKREAKTLKPLVRLSDITGKVEPAKTDTLHPLSSHKNFVVQSSNQRSTGISAEELLNELMESLAKELYMDVEDIETDRSFTELGLDSIIGVEWIRDVNKKFKTSISMTKVYQYPTLMEFVTYLYDVIEKMTGAQECSENQEEKSPKSLSRLPKCTEKEDRVKTTIQQSFSEPTEEEGTATTSQINSRLFMKELLTELTESLARELYMDVKEVDPEASFTELGLDSIIGVEWIRAVNQKFKISISMTKIYQYPTLADFTRYLYEVLESMNKSQEGDEVEELLWQVYQGEVDINYAEKLIGTNRKKG
ncbi:beta-ketoacyl synthase N-terminal-like domain-containing protein [Bacillus halotolerans]|uniref:beta-ketoacyl synthase N-terminal-like domain-containing protein n=1 Tax=Bacillus halotolerans TaxID=260554 RepID=UPI00192AA701|nr:beta-ketoacyl synthase N-terminal-like domain-containing protein [Bacillus halotolerans]MBL4971619.1 hypothetical protein [Bacillus halotolerans]MBL4975504.1 hypothetical protein [Bacillus halotolerans]